MLIRKYLELMTSWVSKISNTLPKAIMTVAPANCPAEVKLVKDITVATNQGSPPLTTDTPKAKDTAKYPSAMGTPSFSPCL